MAVASAPKREPDRDAAARLALCEGLLLTLKGNDAAGQGAAVANAKALLEAKGAKVTLETGGNGAAPREVREAIAGLEAEVKRLRPLAEAQRGKKAKAPKPPARPREDGILRHGASGPRVGHLQNRLNSLGHSLVVDRQYGPKTAAAVKAVQDEHEEVPSTGEVDESTAAVLRMGGKTLPEVPGDETPPQEPPPGDTAPAPQEPTPPEVPGPKPDPGGTAAPEPKRRSSAQSVLFKGVGVGDARSSGPVKDLQGSLQTLGYNVEPDGRFGPETEHAVKRMQRRYGLRSDGIVGPKTQRTIKRVGAKMKKLQETVAERQRAAAEGDTRAFTRARVRERQLRRDLDEATLSTTDRKKLPDSAFVFPERKGYPIHDLAHARNALARVEQHGSESEKKKVKAAVHARYPQLREAELQEGEDSHKLKCPKCDRVQAASNKKCANCGHDLGEARKAKFANLKEGASARDREEVAAGKGSKEDREEVRKARRRRKKQERRLTEADLADLQEAVEEEWFTVLSEAEEAEFIDGVLALEELAHEPLDRSPKKNWVERAGQLPAYIQHIAKDIHEERGIPLSMAIPIAISRVKVWAASPTVSTSTRRKAATAVAEWEALKAKNKAKGAVHDVKKLAAALVDDGLLTADEVLDEGIFGALVGAMPRGSTDRRARIEMKRMPNGKFAPKGTGEVLHAGTPVHVPGQGHGVVTERGAVAMDSGAVLGLHFSARSPNSDLLGLQRQRHEDVRIRGALRPRLAEATVRRGGARRAVAEIKRMDNGEFAPKGTGQILRPGDRVKTSFGTGIVKANRHVNLGGRRIKIHADHFELGKADAVPDMHGAVKELIRGAPKAAPASPGSEAHIDKVHALSAGESHTIGKVTIRRGHGGDNRALHITQEQGGGRASQPVTGGHKPNSRDEAAAAVRKAQEIDKGGPPLVKPRNTVEKSGKKPPQSPGTGGPEPVNVSKAKGIQAGLPKEKLSHIGPNGKPRNFGAMTNEKLYAIRNHPDTPHPAHKAAEAELDKRGLNAETGQPHGAKKSDTATVSKPDATPAGSARWKTGASSRAQAKAEKAAAPHVEPAGSERFKAQAKAAHAASTAGAAPAKAATKPKTSSGAGTGAYGGGVAGAYAESHAKAAKINSAGSAVGAATGKGTSLKDVPEGTHFHTKDGQRYQVHKHTGSVVIAKPVDTDGQVMGPAKPFHPMFAPKQMDTGKAAGPKAEPGQHPDFPVGTKVSTSGGYKATVTGMHGSHIAVKTDAGATASHKPEELRKPGGSAPSAGGGSLESDLQKSIDATKGKKGGDAGSIKSPVTSDKVTPGDFSHLDKHFGAEPTWKKSASESAKGHYDHALGWAKGLEPNQQIGAGNIGEPMIVRWKSGEYQVLDPNKKVSGDKSGEEHARAQAIGPTHKTPEQAAHHAAEVMFQKRGDHPSTKTAKKPPQSPGTGGKKAPQSPGTGKVGSFDATAADLRGMSDADLAAHEKKVSFQSTVAGKSFREQQRLEQAKRTALARIQTEKNTRRSPGTAELSGLTPGQRNVYDQRRKQGHNHAAALKAAKLGARTRQK